MRERVRERTRAVLKQRLLTGVTVVLVVALAISVKLGGDESRSNVVTVDNPAPVEVRRTDEGSAPAPSPSPTTPPTTVPAGLRGQGAAEPGGDGEVPSGSGPPDAQQVEWDLVDPQGDAKYHSRCGSGSIPGCPEESNTGLSRESQPALDVLGIDVQCSSASIRMAYTVLDPTAPVAPSQLGKKAILIYYTSSLNYGSDKNLTFVLAHDLEKDSWRATVLRQGKAVDVPLRVAGSLLEFEFSTEFVGWHPAGQGKAQVFGSSSVIFEGPEPFTRTAMADDWHTPEASVPVCDE